MAGRKTTTPVAGSAEAKVEAKFSKAQLIRSKRFQHRRDILEAVLKDGERYSVKETEAAIEKFMGRKVYQMALGGGTFLVQNKKLPGTYINFVSLPTATATLSDRGTVTMPLELDWGPDNAVFTVTNGDMIKNSRK